MRYLILFGIVVAVCSWINAFKGRPAINPGKVGLVLLLVAYVLEIGIAFVTLVQAPEEIPPFEQGQFIGQITITALVGLLPAFLLKNWFRDRHAAQEPPPPEEP